MKWRARPHTELDATADKHLFFFPGGDETVEEYRKRVRRILQEREVTTQDNTDKQGRLWDNH